MSDERDLAEAIYAELRTDDALDHAVERWYAQPQLHVRARLAVVLDAVTASALDRVLARRQREAARTGPWGEAVPTANDTERALAVRDRDIDELVRSLEHASQQQDEAEQARDDALRKLAEITAARTGPWDGGP